jgi:hypothetical protein
MLISVSEKKRKFLAEEYTFISNVSFASLELNVLKMYSRDVERSIEFSQINVF